MGLLLIPCCWGLQFVFPDRVLEKGFRSRVQLKMHTSWKSQLQFLFVTVDQILCWCKSAYLALYIEEFILTFLFPFGFCYLVVHSNKWALMLKTWKSAFLQLLFSVAPRFDNISCESSDHPGISALDRVILKSLNKFTKIPFSRMERKFAAINFFQVLLVGNWIWKVIEREHLAKGSKFWMSSSVYKDQTHLPEGYTGRTMDRRVIFFFPHWTHISPLGWCSVLCISWGFWLSFTTVPMSWIQWQNHMSTKNLFQALMAQIWSG